MMSARKAIACKEGQSVNVTIQGGSGDAQATGA